MLAGNRLAQDIVVVWIVAVVVMFAMTFAGALSIQDDANTIGCLVVCGLAFVGAIVLTVLLATGSIPTF